MAGDEDSRVPAVANASGASALDLMLSDGQGKPIKSRRKQISEELGALATPLAALQKHMNKYSFIVYSDENKNPQKAKLIRGENGIDANLEFLGIIGNTRLGKLKVQRILLEVADINKLKFTSKAEKTKWVEVMTVRWMNICRVVSVADGKKVRPRWASILPWRKGGEEKEAAVIDVGADDDDDEDDDDNGDKGEEEDGEAVEGSDTEEDDEDPVPNTVPEVGDDADMEAVLQEDGQGNQFEGPETEGSLASAEAIPATDLEAITSARESAYEVKFSTELMLPLRRLKAAKAAAWEPGVLVEGQDDDELQDARWPDGFVATLPDQVGMIKGLRRGGDKGNPEDLWTGICEKTKHQLRLSQRVDRTLLLCLYEQSRQILQIRIDKFGAIEDQSVRLPNNDPRIQAARAFMVLIALDFAAGRISREDLITERNSRLQALPVGAAMQAPTQARSRQRTTPTEATPEQKPAAHPLPQKREASAHSQAKRVKLTNKTKTDQRVVTVTQEKDNKQTGKETSAHKIEQASASCSSVLDLPPEMDSLELLELRLQG